MLCCEVGFEGYLFIDFIDFGLVGGEVLESESV